jgi:N-acetylneuraminic acid mutarotase
MSHQHIDPMLTGMADPRDSRRRRVKALGAFGAAVVALVITVIASLNTGGSSSTSIPLSSKAGQARTGPVRGGAAPVAPPTLAVARVGSLPSPVAGPAGAVSASGDVLLIGGFDSAGTVVGAIDRIATGHASQAGVLSNPLHGAVATRVGGAVYLFGGGASSPDSAIVRVGSDGTTTTVDQLPQPVLDAAAATVGDTAYVVGGFTGTSSLSSIVAWKPGSGTQVVANLPTPLRFAAVASVAGHVVIAGGTIHGAASRAIYSFDPTSATVTRIGWLPRPLTRAAAGVLAGKLYVIGGRGNARASQSRSIYLIDPNTGAVTPAATMPVALSDAAAASLPNRILIAGGSGRDGRPQQAIFSVTPR